MRDLKAAFSRSHETMLIDAAGLASLIAMLIVGLHLPDLI